MIGDILTFLAAMFGVIFVIFLAIYLTAYFGDK